MRDYKLTLGPCFFNWTVNDWRDFYYKIAEESDIDEVYLGEVVCYKRYPFFEVAFDAVVDRLRACNKIVHFSTFSLILGDLEWRVCENLADRAKSDGGLVEVNDVGLLGKLYGSEYIVGPTVNVYNEATAQTLESQGAKRLCFPYELDRYSIGIIARAIKTEKEVFAFGRIPLAIGARCYHARIHHTTKDDCKYVCEKDYNGKDIFTLDDNKFLTVNGTQTMSSSYVNLINELADLKELGVNIFRISPHHMDMLAVIKIFRQVLDHQMSSKEANALLLDQLPLTKDGNKPDFSNGFYYGIEGRSYNNKPLE